MPKTPKNEFAPLILAARPSPELGPALRQWRVEKGFSLRAAAAELDVSFAYLQKLETGGRASPPTLTLLQRMAAVYDVPTNSLFAAAGVTPHRLEDARDSVDRAFRRLVLHPKLCPQGMDELWVSSFSVRQKRQWIEFAQRLLDVFEDSELISIELEEIIRGDPPFEEEVDEW